MSGWDSGVTGFPHFRQNCEPSGKLAPHWVQMEDGATASAVLFSVVPIPQRGQDWESSERFVPQLLHNTGASLFDALGRKNCRVILA
jgi:hypothetical protein